MKRKKIFPLIIFLAITACDVLDLEPVSQINTDQAFADLSSAQGVVNGMYNVFQGVYMWREQVLSDVSSDVSQQVDTWDALNNADEFNLTADNSEVSDLYTLLYRTVDISNNIIDQVPQMDIDQEYIDDMTGQAYFIRGLSYFDLSRFWGGIPNVYGDLGVVIKLTPSSGISESDYAERNTLAACYQQVEDDLLQALALLPETRSSNTDFRGKATKAAARALLARYYLYMQDWAQAGEYATQVIDDPDYELVTPYENIFRVENSNESIFELQFTNTDIQGLRNWYFPATLGGRGGSALHDELYAELTADPNDTRAGLTALNENAGAYYTTKWSASNEDDNFQLLRIAEQYLIRSEARAEQGNLAGAISDLNMVRSRAGVGNTTASSQEQVIAAILQERKLEFIGEGHRWFDVIRRGLALTVFTGIKRTTGSLPSYSIGSADKQVFPFPVVETLANPNLVQNDGYK